MPSRGCPSPSYLGLALAALLWATSARAEIPNNTITIGVLNDMNGPFADLSGRNSVVAAQMAAEDFAKSAGPGAPQVKIVSADHQNKADVGAAITRQWVDRDGVEIGRIFYGGRDLEALLSEPG